MEQRRKADDRKLDGAMEESSAEQHIHNQTRLYIWCEKRALHLTGPGLMAGLLGDKIQVKSENFKACYGSKYSIFCFVLPRCSIFSASLMHF